MTIAEKLALVRARIVDAAHAAGRNADAVRLVAVTKGHSADAVREAYAAGQRVFGESYAQEFAAKADALADLSDIEWHFIGHLQTNKAKLVAARASYVHSVDSVHLARELGRRTSSAARILSVLVEVNVAGEAQKSGVPPQELEDVLVAVEAEQALRLRGLMTMPPFGDLEAARSTFGTLAALRNMHGGVSRLPDLSMGMSEDLELGVAAGATFVRIGTAIFGPRG